MSTTEELLAEILRLPRAERARVVEEVLSSLEEPAEDVAAAWAAELERRARVFCVVLPGWVLVCAGFGQPLEWAEFPLSVACFVVLGFVLAIVQFVTPFLKKGLSGLYVSAWYIIGGLIFTTLAYPVGNLAPQLLPGAIGAAFSGLWIHDAVGLYVTPLVLAVAYFVIPVAAGRPIYSHFLSMIGFWLLSSCIR